MKTANPRTEAKSLQQAVELAPKKPVAVRLDQIPNNWHFCLKVTFAESMHALKSKAPRGSAIIETHRCTSSQYFMLLRRSPTGSAQHGNFFNNSSCRDVPLMLSCFMVSTVFHTTPMQLRGSMNVGRSGFSSLLDFEGSDGLSK